MQSSSAAMVQAVMAMLLKCRLRSRLVQPNRERLLSRQQGNRRTFAERAGAIDDPRQAVRHDVQEARDPGQEEDGRERELDCAGDIGDVFG